MGKIGPCRDRFPGRNCRPSRQNHEGRDETSTGRGKPTTDPSPALPIVVVKVQHRLANAVEQPAADPAT